MLGMLSSKRTRLGLEELTLVPSGKHSLRSDWEVMLGLLDRLPGVVESGLMVTNSHRAFVRSTRPKLPKRGGVAGRIKAGRKGTIKANLGSFAVMFSHLVYQSLKSEVV